ncbi:hypothetical protein JI59_07940 [Novosphingobium pentaromativorans US6-1]|uniref:Flippase-like domain-containing protein n=1 Tax=Novosphingobium pentaromativorans US6-1 TaxID=1088721 RepID=G6EDL0_9SPHN|nr:hypothetical protein JI59_07940 [Novosphingobium pentaromativorans US6-1]EHJ60638.1 hypothetical protein NSU_2431 [Novosphingobium pentaromativorans US6-1]
MAPDFELRAQDTFSRLRSAVSLPLAFTGLIALAVILTLRGMDMQQVLVMVPRQPLFWFVFAAFYLCGPMSEWIIFHKLWALPAGGFGALMRKLVCNELLLGYLGEAYFYTWARRHSAMTNAPFAAIKDVAILSAMVGNAITLVLLVLTWPIVHSTRLGMENTSLVFSLVAVLATSIAVMAFRRRLFSLDRRELAFISFMHLARIVVATVLSALLWHMVLPDVPIIWWLFLATLRLLISRLPLVPNKDVVFAGLAVLTLGHETSIAILMTMMASAILLVHLLVGTGLVIGDLVRGEKPA